MASARPSRGVASTEPDTVHDLGLDTSLAEQHPRRDRIGRRNPETTEILDRGLRRIVRNGRLERAPRESELGQRDDVGLGLDDEVRTRDAEVDDAVLDVLRDVARADEEQVDRRVCAGNDERALGRLEREARVGAESERRLGHPALRRHGERQPAVLACAREGAHRFTLSSAIR